MDRDTLYYHFANLGLVLIGLLSIQAILSPFAVLILVLGIIAGFILSWQMRDSRPRHIDTFAGMLSLAAVVIIIGRLYDVAITFENLLRIFSTTLVWLMLFQSFGLKTGKSYAIVQFISVALLISSVSLALEQELFYTVLIALFLFIFIFILRLNLVCERKRKGSVIIGDQEEIMGLWQQIKVAAVMFSLVLILASLMYPLVPRFESLSFDWIPSTLLGIPEKVPLLKLLKQAPMKIKEDKRVKEEQLVDDDSKKRETDSKKMREGIIRKQKKDEEEKKKEHVERFPSREFNEDIDIFKVESLTINSDRDEVSLGEECRVEAELRLNDGSTIPATRLVDWKVSGTASVSIDADGKLTPKEKGEVLISATYVGTFSNDVKVKVTTPLVPEERRSAIYYVFLILFWLVIFSLASLTAWVFIKSKRLSELANKDPREFIRQIYIALCRAFKLYGSPRLIYMAHREFFESIKGLLSSRPEPMHLMTETVLEASFSTHALQIEDSWKALGLFHEVKEVILERQERKGFWRKILFRVFVLDVLLIPRKI